MDTGHIDNHLAWLLPGDSHGLRLGDNIEPNGSTASLLGRPVSYLPNAGAHAGLSPLDALCSNYALHDQPHSPLLQPDTPTHLDPLAVQPANKFHAEHDPLADEAHSVFDVDVDAYAPALLIDPRLDDLPQLQQQGEAHDVGPHAEVIADIKPIKAVNQQDQGLRVWIDDQVYANEDLPMDRDEEEDLESDSGTEPEYVPTRQSSPVISRSLYVPYRPVVLARGKTPTLAPVTRRAAPAPVGQRKTQPGAKRPRSETRAAPAILQRSVRDKAFDPLAKKTTFDFVICALLASDLLAHKTAIRWQAGSQTVIEIVNTQTFLSKIWKKYFAPGRRSFNRQLGNYGFVRVIRRQDCTKGPLLLEKPGLRQDDQVFWAKIRELNVLGLHKVSKSKGLYSCDGAQST